LCVQLSLDTLVSLKWTIAKTVLTLSFSALGILLIHYISDYSLFVKHTRNEGSTITKIALFQLINSFLVPVAAFFVSGPDSFQLWCVPSCHLCCSRLPAMVASPFILPSLFLATVLLYSLGHALSHLPSEQC
jgi:hypothetical protein